MSTLSSLIRPDRMLLVNWAAQLTRSVSGTPLLPAEFVACQGRKVRLIDVRGLEELTGPLGHIPGANWVPFAQALALGATQGHAFEPDSPTIIVSRTNERSGEIARALETRGMRYVAALTGGMISWNNLGFLAVRDPAIAERCGQLSPVLPSFTNAGSKLDKQDIENHIGDPLSIRWMKFAAFLLHARLSCVDGRDDRGVVGTPGGDAGEFLLALSAAEAVRGKPFIDSEVTLLLRRRIDAFGRFYMHSDVAALQKLVASVRNDPRLSAVVPRGKDALEWRALFSTPKLDARAALLDHLVMPEHNGCGHLRLMLQNPELYGVRGDLSVAFARAFHQLRWEGSLKTEHETLAGGHEEAAVLNVLVEGELWPFTPVPLISPSCLGGQLFVNHPQVSHALRAQTGTCQRI
jgi:rhodanese-related sulfurtransferase